MISVDPREGSKQYATLLEARGLPVTVERLPYGDVAFSGHGPKGLVQIGVEIKTAGDFASSFSDKRWHQQLGGMQRMYDHSVLLVTNDWDDIHPGLFLSMHYLGGILVHTSLGSEEGAEWIESLYKWWQKPWEKHQSLQGLQLPQDRSSEFTLVPTDHSLTRLWAACLPGIGWELSARVERQFPSAAHLALAPREAWTDVDGIGKARAQAITDAINKMRK